MNKNSDNYKVISVYLRDNVLWLVSETRTDAWSYYDGVPSSIAANSDLAEIGNLVCQHLAKSRYIAGEPDIKAGRKTFQLLLKMAKCRSMKQFESKAKNISVRLAVAERQLTFRPLVYTPSGGYSFKGNEPQFTCPADNPEEIGKTLFTAFKFAE